MQSNQVIYKFDCVYHVSLKILLLEPKATSFLFFYIYPLNLHSWYFFKKKCFMHIFIRLLLTKSLSIGRISWKQTKKVHCNDKKSIDDNSCTIEYNRLPTFVVLRVVKTKTFYYTTIIISQWNQKLHLSAAYKKKQSEKLQSFHYLSISILT